MAPFGHVDVDQLQQFSLIGHGHPVIKARVGDTDSWVVLKGEERNGSMGAKGSAERAGLEIPLKIKKSFELMAEMYQFVTLEVGEFRVLSKDEVRRIRIPPWGHSELALHNPKAPSVMWYLMECFEHLDDLSCLRGRDERERQKQQRIKPLIETTPALFEDLGKVIVVDLFVGNTDRVVNEDARGWRVVNMGNIFINTDPAQKRAKIIGLDFFEKSSGYTSFNVPLRANDQRWPGRLLDKGNDKGRDELATQIIEFLKGPEGGLQLNKDHLAAFKKGMHKGRRRLRDWYSKHKDKVTAFPGLSSRFAAIHVEKWSWL